MSRDPPADGGREQSLAWRCGQSCPRLLDLGHEPLRLEDLERSSHGLAATVEIAVRQERVGECEVTVTFEERRALSLEADRFSRLRDRLAVLATASDCDTNASD